MVKILHFADAHIDMANYGRHDPVSGLPLRVMDFLKSLDTIVDAAIDDKVDLVIFAGDAYKDRNPAPTFQREWGRRIMRLSRAKIPTILLIGNHDRSPALGRAHALDAFDTLDVPFIKVIDKPRFLKPTDMEGVPVQVMAIPWISRSGLSASLGLDASLSSLLSEELEKRLNLLLDDWFLEVDKSIPVIFTAHASVQGAKYGAERSIMLGSDLVLSGSLIKNSRFDYVALGHIHLPQNIHPEAHPPVIYPGSIERVDFGEAGDDKYFIIAEIERGLTQLDWRRLSGIRPMIDCHCQLDKPEALHEQILTALPPGEQIPGAIVRLVLEYPRDWEAMIDETRLREYTSQAFEFHLIKRPQVGSRIRIPKDQGIGSLSPMELLEIYWRTIHTQSDDLVNLRKLAQEIISQPD